MQSLKQSLKASASSKLPLQKRVCEFLLKYRTSVHATTGQTPGQLFLNRELRTRLDLLKPDVSVQIRKKQAQQKATHDQHAKS